MRWSSQQAFAADRLWRMRKGQAPRFAKEELVNDKVDSFGVGRIMVTIYSGVIYQNVPITRRAALWWVGWAGCRVYFMFALSAQN